MHDFTFIAPLFSRYKVLSYQGGLLKIFFVRRVNEKTRTVADSIDDCFGNLCRHCRATEATAQVTCRFTKAISGVICTVNNYSTIACIVVDVLFHTI